MLWQCGIQEIYFSDLSSPKQCFYGDVYGQVLGQITQRIKFLYVPKRKLTDIFLKESSEKFSQND
jgi:hypothetical protein